MSLCGKSGLGVIDDGTLPQEPEFLAVCDCGRTVTVANGRIEWHQAPPPADETRRRFDEIAARFPVVRLHHHFIPDDESNCWECGNTEDHADHQVGVPLTAHTDGSTT